MLGRPFRIWMPDVNIEVDSRPASDLSVDEVVAYLLKAIRNQDIRTMGGVQVAYGKLFPDMPPERWPEHAQALAQRLL